MKKLYINGQLADVDDNTKVGLSYKSPLFSEITTMTANSTTTIKIPGTARNNRLIEGVGIAGVLSGFAYEYFRVDYIDRGFEVISGGKGYLLSAGEAIEMSVIFGGSAKGFAALKDVKLTEMAVPALQSKVEWKGASWTPSGQTPGVRWIDMQYDGLMAKETDFRFVHPCVSVKQVVDWIQGVYGVQLWMFGGSLDNWVVPCVTKNRRKGETGVVTELDQAYQQGPFDRKFMYRFTGIGERKLYKYLDQSGIRFHDDGEVTFKINYTWVDSKGVRNIGNLARSIEIYEASLLDGPKSYKEDKGGQISVSVRKTSYYVFYFWIYHEGRDIVGITDVKLTVTPPKEELMYGEEFDVVPNLPDIKVTDFIKAIAGMTASFPVPDRWTPERVQFRSLRALYDAQAVDWSDRLMEVVSVGYRYGDYAQSNTINWAEDDVVRVKDVGVIGVSNGTLALNKKLVELPFAACDQESSSTGRASLNIYKKEGEVVEDKSVNPPVGKWRLTGAKLQKVKPRIVYDTVTAPRIGKVIRIAGEGGLIAQNYEHYKKVVGRPQVVKATMMLSAGDLAQLDLMVPVFVEQLNGVFAVMEVKDKEGISEVEMLRL